MNAEMGEYLVGAYLKVIEGCEFVDYGVRAPGGGIEGLDELDVLGLNFDTRTAFVCEVTTHIRGLLYKDNPTTVKRVSGKFQKQKRYAAKRLQHFPNHRFMFWSPVVPRGYLTESLARIGGLELVINEEYTRRVNLLTEKARELSNDVGNPAFRLLQILEHLRKPSKG